MWFSFPWKQTITLSLLQLDKQLNILLIIQSRTSATLNEVAISSRIMANPSSYLFTCEHNLRSSPLIFCVTNRSDGLCQRASVRRGTCLVIIRAARNYEECCIWSVLHRQVRSNGITRLVLKNDLMIGKLTAELIMVHQLEKTCNMYECFLNSMSSRRLKELY